MTPPPSMSPDRIISPDPAWRFRGRSPCPSSNRACSPARSCASYSTRRSPSRERGVISERFPPSPREPEQEVQQEPIACDSPRELMLPPLPEMSSPVHLPRPIEMLQEEACCEPAQAYTRPASLYSLRAVTPRTASRSSTPDYPAPPTFDEPVLVSPQRSVARSVPPSPIRSTDSPIQEISSSALISGLLKRFIDVTDRPVPAQDNMVDLEMSLLPELAQLKVALDQLSTRMFDFGVRSRCGSHSANV